MTSVSEAANASDWSVDAVLASTSQGGDREIPQKDVRIAEGAHHHQRAAECMVRDGRGVGGQRRRPHHQPCAHVRMQHNGRQGSRAALPALSEDQVRLAPHRDRLPRSLSIRLACTKLHSAPWKSDWDVGRDDKSVEDATSAEQMVDMFRKQANRGGGDAAGAVNAGSESDDWD